MVVWSKGGVWSGAEPPEIATATVSTHPTGMHSCLSNFRRHPFTNSTVDHNSTGLTSQHRIRKKSQCNVNNQTYSR